MIATGRLVRVMLACVLVDRLEEFRGVSHWAQLSVPSSGFL